VPHILLSVRKIERSSEVTGPIGIMGIVAISVPREILAEDLLSKRDRDQLGGATCLIFASGRRTGRAPQTQCRSAVPKPAPGPPAGDSALDLGRWHRPRRYA
jgi:hypothetical protein